MAFYKRKYRNYENYLEHQRKKLGDRIEHLKAKSSKRVRSFVENFKEVSPKIRGPRVLCLAARLGEEVQAFIELGHSESIGIDLNPGPDNKYVIEGDFHNIPFPDNEFDCIYCNCLDHAWELKKVSAECARVIKPKGLLFLDVPFVQNYKNHNYKKNVKKKNKYESMLWDSLSDVLSQFDEFHEIYDREPSNTHKIKVFLQLK